jgi:hypothetical protein
VYVAPRLPSGTFLVEPICFRFTPTFGGYGGPVDACTSPATRIGTTTPSYRLGSLPAGTWTVSPVSAPAGLGAPPSLPRTIAVNNSINGSGFASTTTEGNPLVVTYPMASGLRVRLEGRGVEPRDVCITATSTSTGATVRRCETGSLAGDDDGVLRQITLPLAPGTSRLSFSARAGVRTPTLGDLVVGAGQVVPVDAVLRGTGSVYVAPRGDRGQLLAGTCLRFTPQFTGYGGPIDRCTADGSFDRLTRTYRFDGITAGEYVVTEVVTPPGYLPPGALPATIRVNDSLNTALPTSNTPTSANTTTRLFPLELRHRAL